MPKISIRAKLVRLFTLQMLLISVATISGIYVTNTLVQDLLMRNALDGEAAHFWQSYQQNPLHPIPNTNNLIGYLLDSNPLASEQSNSRRYGEPPLPLLTITNNYGRLEIDNRTPTYHVSQQGDKRLYLLFDGDAVSDVTILYGIAPLSLVLLIIYGLSFLAYRWSQQAVSPFVRLARYIDSIDLNGQAQHNFDLESLHNTADAEVSTMIAAVASLGRRLDEFVERERLFTRDASHELRTPIAVFKGSLDLIEHRNTLTGTDHATLSRMRRSVNGMESLVETLLMLAREDGFSDRQEPCNMVPLVQDQVDALQALAKQANNTLSVHSTDAVVWGTHPRVIEILTTNLVSNALQYTHAGNVTVEISPTHLQVSDTGIGMNESEIARIFQPFYRADPADGNGGYGLGLAIVRRLVDKCGWTIQVSSTLGKGTTIRIQFAP